MDNRIGEMQVFLHVVEEQSFSEAARRMWMTPSTVSKLIARMEKRLGVRLIERSTRRLLPTAEGQRYYDRCRALLNELDDMERDLVQKASDISGTVRITASVGFGVFAIEPLIPEFSRAYPKISLDISLSDEIVDLYGERTHVAFRVGRLTDSALIARKIGTTPRMLVASPGYLARSGTPLHVRDLADHACIGFNFRHRNLAWPLDDGERMIEYRPEYAMLANNGETVRRMTLAGLGIARMGEFHIRQELRDGSLIQVLPDATKTDFEDTHALFVGNDHMPQRVKAFLDFMVPRLRSWLQE